MLSDRGGGLSAATKTPARRSLGPRGARRGPGRPAASAWAVARVRSGRTAAEPRLPPPTAWRGAGSGAGRRAMGPRHSPVIGGLACFGHHRPNRALYGNGAKVLVRPFVPLYRGTSP